MKRHDCVCDSEPTIDVYGGRIEFYRHHKSLPRDFFFLNNLPLTIKDEKEKKQMTGCYSKSHFPTGGVELFFFCSF